MLSDKAADCNQVLWLKWQNIKYKRFYKKKNKWFQSLLQQVIHFYSLISLILRWQKKGTGQPSTKAMSNDFTLSKYCILKVFMVSRSAHLNMVKQTEYHENYNPEKQSSISSYNMKCSHRVKNK